MTSVVLTTVLQAVLLVTPGNGYQEAYQKSLATGRPLVVLLGADWCPACLTMKNSILPRVDRSGGLKEVELAYVDVDREPEMAELLSRAPSIPQLLRFEKKPTGWVRQMLLGSQSPEKVSSFVQGEPAQTPAASQPPTVLGSLPTAIGVPTAQ